MQSQYVLQYENLEKHHWWWIARREIVCVILSKLATRGEQRPRVLDIGCGAGMQLSILDGFDAVGVEPNPILAERARANTSAEILNEGLPIHPSSLNTPFDFILLLDVLEHLDHDVEGLRSAMMALKPGGFVIVNVPAHPWLWSVHDDMNEHKRRYTRKQLSQVLEDAGLHLESIQFWGSILVPAAFLRGRKATKKDYLVNIPSGPIAQILRSVLKVDFFLNKYLLSFAGLSLLAVGRKLEEPATA